MRPEAPQTVFMFVFSLFHLVPRNEALVIRIAPTIFTLCIHRVSYFAGLSIYCKALQTCLWFFRLSLNHFQSVLHRSYMILLDH